MLSRGAGSPAFPCWRCSSQYSPECCWVFFPQERIAGSRSTCPSASPLAGGQAEQKPHLFSGSYVGYNDYPIVTILSCYMKKNKNRVIHMTWFAIQQCASELCSGGDIYQNYSWADSKQKDYFGWEKNIIVFCNLYSKVTLLTIREHCNAHTLQQETNKKNQTCCLIRPENPQILCNNQVSVSYHCQSCSQWESPYSKEDWVQCWESEGSLSSFSQNVNFNVE